MSSYVDAESRTAPSLAQVLDLGAKGMLVLLSAMAWLDPVGANLDGKGAELRAVGYPMLAFTVPAFWYLFTRERPFPWLADLLVTITCFSDTLGNRMDLYDQIVWFDDWMHFMNPALLCVAVLLLSVPRDAGFGACLERCLAFGATAAITWEVAEFFAFIATSDERRGAYTDTLGDLSAGVAGCVFAAVLVSLAWRRGRLREPGPLSGPYPLAAESRQR